MVNEQFRRFPDTDPERLWILLKGRQVSEREWRHWTRVLFGGRKRLLLLVLITACLFIPDMLMTLASGEYAWYETAVCSLLLFTATVWAAISFYRILRFPAVQVARQYQEYAADIARHAVGTRIAFYGDRVTATSLRGTTLLRLDCITVCVETSEGFVLGDGTQWIVIRAQDLIAYDADLVRAYLTERIDPRCIRVKGAVQPQLQQPLLPISQNSEPTVLTTAQLVQNRTEIYRTEQQKLWRMLLQAALSLSVAAAVALALWIPISKWVLVDLLYFCAISAVIATGFARIAFKRSGRRHIKEPMQIGFEPDGLRITCGGSSRFFVKERLWLTAETSGVRVCFADTNTLFIPYDAVEDANVLRALAGVPTESVIIED